MEDTEYRPVEDPTSVPDSSLAPPALAYYDLNCGFIYFCSEASNLDLAPLSTLPPIRAFPKRPSALDAYHLLSRVGSQPYFLKTSSDASRIHCASKALPGYQTFLRAAQTHLDL